MHSKLSDEFEQKIQNCNSLKELHTVCGGSPSDVNKSLETVIKFLKNIIQRLELKEEPFSTYNAADEDKIEVFGEILQQTDQLPAMSDTSKKAIKDKKHLL